MFSKTHINYGLLFVICLCLIYTYLVLNIYLLEYPLIAYNFKSKFLDVKYMNILCHWTLYGSLLIMLLLFFLRRLAFYTAFITSTIQFAFTLKSALVVTCESCAQFGLLPSYSFRFQTFFFACIMVLSFLGVIQYNSKNK